jgi:hypothetical protein
MYQYFQIRYCASGSTILNRIAFTNMTVQLPRFSLQRYLNYRFKHSNTTKLITGFICAPVVVVQKN